MAMHAVREYAYDRESSVGRLDKALEEAKVEGWTVVDMKKDWQHIFPFEKLSPIRRSGHLEVGDEEVAHGSAFSFEQQQRRWRV